jgi:3-phenylpropionate/trans-cinnamate dioxygenase ferredoxin subunit
MILGASVLSHAPEKDEIAVMKHTIEVPASADLRLGKRARVRANGTDIALFNVDGQIYAIDDSCPHNGASLLFGKLDGHWVQCPAHGLRFDLTTGCMRGGGMNVRAYPVDVVEGCIRITLPTPITDPQ